MSCSSPRTRRPPAGELRAALFLLASMVAVVQCRPDTARQPDALQASPAATAYSSPPSSQAAAANPSGPARPPHRLPRGAYDPPAEEGLFSGTLAVAVLDGGSIAIAWDESPSQEGASTIRAAVLNAQTGTWQPSVAVSNGEGEGRNPALAALSGGGFVVAWMNANPAQPAWRIQWRLFDAGGLAVSESMGREPAAKGEPFQQFSAVSGFPDGGFLVAWEEGPTAEEALDIRYALFDKRGQCRVDMNVGIRPFAVRTHPMTAVLDDGSFVIVWEEREKDGRRQIGGCGFDAAGSALSEPFILATGTGSLSRHPSVESLERGLVAVAWESQDADGFGSGIFGQFLESDGTPRGAVFRLNDVATGDQQDVQLMRGKAGALRAAWIDCGQAGLASCVVAEREFRPGAPMEAGRTFFGPTASEVRYARCRNPHHPEALLLHRFRLSDGSLPFRLLLGTADGLPLFEPDPMPQWIPGAENRINSRWFQKQAAPTAVPLADGALAVAWESCPGPYDEPPCQGQDGDSCGVVARVLDAANGEGTEFLLSSLGAGSQTAVALAASSNAGLRGAWISDPSDRGRGERIVTRIFSISGTPEDPEQSASVPPPWVADRPKLLRLGDAHLLAWPESSERDSRIRLARLASETGTEFEAHVVADCAACAVGNFEVVPAEGEAWIVWTQSPRTVAARATVALRRIATNGEPLGRPFFVSPELLLPSSARLAAAASGPTTILLAWAAADGTYTTGVEYCVLDVETGRCGGRNRVAAVAGAVDVRVAVAVGSQGAAIAWWSLDLGVWVRTYGSAMSGEGPAVRLNSISHARGGPRFAPLAVLEHGNSYWTFWEGVGPDGSQGSIFGRRLGDPGGPPLAPSLSGPALEHMPKDLERSGCAVGQTAKERPHRDGTVPDLPTPRGRGHDWSLPLGRPTSSYLAGGPPGVVLLQQERTPGRDGPAIAGLLPLGGQAWENLELAADDGATMRELLAMGACEKHVALVTHGPEKTIGCLSLDLISYKGDLLSRNPLPASCPAHDSAPAVACLRDGAVAVAWTAARQGGDRADVFCHIVAPSSLTSSLPIRINELPEGAEDGPALSAFEDGRFVIVWKGEEADGRGGSVRARLIEPDGTPFGQELRLDSGGGRQPSHPKVAAGSEGYFLAVWESLAPMNGQSEIRATVGGRGGMPYLSDFPVSMSLSGRQHAPVALSLPDSSFVVAWESDIPGSEGEIRFSHLLANGLLDRGEGFVRPGDRVSATRPQLAFRPGGFLLGWSLESQFGGRPHGFRAREVRLDSRGAAGVRASPPEESLPQGGAVFAGDGVICGPGEMTIRPEGDGLPGFPAIAVTDDDQAMVIWTARHGRNSAVLGVLAPAGGQQHGDVIHLSNPEEGVSGRPVVAAFPAGAFTACWIREVAAQHTGVVCRSIDAAGGGVAARSSVTPTLGGLLGGLSVAGHGSTGALAWHQQGSDMSGNGIVVQRLAPDGTPTAEAVIANRLVGGNQENPALAALDGGTLGLAWEGERQDDRGKFDIFVRLLGLDGFLDDEEVRVNTEDRRHGQPPLVVALHGRRYCVVWVSDSSGPGTRLGTSFHARCSDESGIPSGQEFDLPGLANAGDGAMGTVSAGGERFLVTSGIPGMPPEYRIVAVAADVTGASAPAPDRRPVGIVHGPSGYAIARASREILFVGADRSVRLCRIPLSEALDRW